MIWVRKTLRFNPCQLIVTSEFTEPHFSIMRVFIKERDAILSNQECSAQGAPAEGLSRRGSCAAKYAGGVKDESAKSINAAHPKLKPSTS